MKWLLVLLAGLVTASTCFVWRGGVMCAPAWSGPRGHDAMRLVGTWELTSEVGVSQLLVIEPTGTLHFVALEEGLGWLSARARAGASVPWVVAGGHLRFEHTDIAPGLWSVTTTRLEFDPFDGVHPEVYRRVRCLGP